MWNKVTYFDEEYKWTCVKDKVDQSDNKVIYYFHRGFAVVDGSYTVVKSGKGPRPTLKEEKENRANLRFLLVTMSGTMIYAVSNDIVFPLGKYVRFG